MLSDAETEAVTPTTTTDQLFGGLLKRLRERHATNAQLELSQPGRNQQRILQVIEKRAK